MVFAVDRVSWIHFGPKACPFGRSAADWSGTRDTDLIQGEMATYNKVELSQPEEKLRSDWGKAEMI